MEQCRAKSKRSGEQCKNYASKGYKVCRFHGARGGPKTVKGKEKSRLARLTHGFYSEAEKQERRALRQAIKEAKSVEHQVNLLTQSRF